jgi:hypothetical protein
MGKHSFSGDGAAWNPKKNFRTSIVTFSGGNQSGKQVGSSDPSPWNPGTSGTYVPKASVADEQRKDRAGNFPGKSAANSLKQQVVSITYEEIGLFPRSFNRVFDRFFKQLFFDVDNLVIQEYRFYRYLFLTTVKCVFILLFVPLSVNFIAKNYFVGPITEYYWNTHQTEIFLNSYQQKRAFNELKNFEEKIYFESLILSNPDIFILSSSAELRSPNFFPGADKENGVEGVRAAEKPNGSKKSFFSGAEEGKQSDSIKDPTQALESQKNKKFSEIFTKSIQTSLQSETIQLAKHYNEESIEAITNFFADLISFSTLFILLFRLEIQLNITKSFLAEVFFGLDDTKKSLCLLFVTDLLVGYHSPNIWELFFSSVFDRYGLPESQTTIFLLVATLPVLLDVLFKYLIFRHLNRASPATVATYHAMIE